MDVKLMMMMMMSLQADTKSLALVNFFHSSIIFSVGSQTYSIIFRFVFESINSIRYKYK